MAPTSDTTSTGHWREAFALAESLEQQPHEAQRAHIAALAASDPQLAHRLGLLLGSETTKAEIEASVTKVLGATRVAAENPLKTDDNVGAYTLIRRLGRGGMADVWLAQRTDGALKRPVALKLPMAVMPAAMLAERFARERDMLAQLDHPNIARIYDTGTTAQGQPFLALEFIDGEPLDHYCRSAKSSINARVQLALQVAHAVHHAHSRLVLHRDLKPSNILVTKDGTVKVLDFGIAKLLSEERTAEETQFTRMTGAALTPKYAAPEQLLSETVTTSTDTYALAVVLYELLSGAIPFIDNAKDLSARMATLNSPCRLLSETAISAPQVLALGLNSERVVKRALAGDLTAILDKALRRAPNDRYPSALAFAEDLERYLTSRPVLARQGAVTYRVRKFLNRHRVPVAVAAMGTLAAAGLGLQAITQSQKAAQSQLRADSIDGLMESLFQGMSPDIAAKRTFTAKELLDRASGYLGKGDNLEAAAASNAKIRMASLYRDIGDFPSAQTLLLAALESAKQRRDTEAEMLATIQLADATSRAGALADTEKWIAQAQTLAQASKVQPPHKLLARLALVQGQQDWLSRKSDSALAFFSSAESQLRALGAKDIELLTWALEGQGLAAQSQGDLLRARAKFEAILEIDKTSPERGEIDRLRSVSRLANVNYFDGRFAEAVAPLQSVCATFRERLGITHHETIAACQGFAYCSLRLGKWDDSREILQALLAALPASETQQIRGIEQLKAFGLMYEGRAEEAHAALATAVEDHLTLKTESTDAGLRARRHLADNLLRQDKTGLAMSQLAKIEQEQIALRGEFNPDVAITRVLRAVGFIRQGDFDAARARLKPAVEVLTAKRGTHHPFTLSALSYHALVNPSVERIEVAARVTKELGWQAGARALAERLSRPSNTPSDLANIPVVL